MLNYIMQHILSGLSYNATAQSLLQKACGYREQLNAGACTQGCQGRLLHTVQRYGALDCCFTGLSTEVERLSCAFKKAQNLDSTRILNVSIQLAQQRYLHNCNTRWHICGHVYTNSMVRLLWSRAVAAESAARRRLLGMMQPVDSIPVPNGWQTP